MITTVLLLMILADGTRSSTTTDTTVRPDLKPTTANEWEFWYRAERARLVAENLRAEHERCEKDKAAAKRRGQRVERVVIRDPAPACPESTLTATCPECMDAGRERRVDWVWPILGAAALAVGGEILGRALNEDLGGHIGAGTGALLGVAFGILIGADLGW